MRAASPKQKSRATRAARPEAMNDGRWMNGLVPQRTITVTRFDGRVRDAIRDHDAQLENDDLAFRPPGFCRGCDLGDDAAMRGASERLLPILVTALVTALGLLPLAIGSGAPGREVEGPMAIIILGGLFTSTALDLLVLPTLALRYGSFGEVRMN